MPNNAAMYADIACRLQLHTDPLVPPASRGDGLWQTYDGGGMYMALDLGDGEKTYWIYIDLSTLHWGDTVPALRWHDDHQALGWWTDTHVVSGALIQRLHLLAMPENDESGPYAMASEEHFAAASMRGLIASGMPMQASVRVYPDGDHRGAWEAVTEATDINGRTVTPHDHLPTVVLRHGRLRETSLLTLGASTTTGQLMAEAAASLFAAASITPANPAEKDTPMPTNKERKASLIEEHGEEHTQIIAEMISDDASDEDIAAAIAEYDEEQRQEEVEAAQAAAAAAKEEAEAAKAEAAAAATELQEAKAKIAALEGRRSPPQVPRDPQGAAASLRRSTMSEQDKLNFARKNGEEAYASLPY